MLPRDLKPEQFSGYPPEAKKLVTNYIAALQRLPLSFLPSLLREAIEYDFKFPPERKALERELANLNSLSAQEQKDWLQGFEQIHLSAALERFDWINSPAQFVSNYLPISGPRTSSMPFALPPWLTPTACTPPSRPSLRQFRGWASASSAGAWPATTNPFSANCAPTARITPA